MFDLAIKMFTLGVVNIFDYTPELTYSEACNTLTTSFSGTSTPSTMSLMRLMTFAAS